MNKTAKVSSLLKQIELEVTPTHCEFHALYTVANVNLCPKYIRGTIRMTAFTYFDNNEITLVKSNVNIAEYTRTVKKLNNLCIVNIKVRDSSMETNNYLPPPFTVSEYNYMRTVQTTPQLTNAVIDNILMQ